MEPQGSKVSWLKVAPYKKDTWTDEQKAQAILLKGKEVMAGAFLVLNSAQDELEDMPSQFEMKADFKTEAPQGASDTTSYPGLYLGLHSFEQA